MAMAMGTLAATVRAGYQLIRGRVFIAPFATCPSGPKKRLPSCARSCAHKGHQRRPQQ